MIDDCIRWDGPHRKHDGRPVLRREYVYRLRWEERYGPLDSTVVLHHLCHNVWCVNVEHLEPMPQGVHLQAHGLAGDWGQRLKPRCPQGHPYEGANLYVYARQDGTTERHCRECRRAARRRYRAKRL